MTVKRIVVDISTPDVSGVRDFYAGLFGLGTVMDLEWVTTLATAGSAAVQLTIASTGGSGAPVPDLSIEVEDVEALFTKAKAMGAPIEYPLTDEPWGVRRFFLRDPAGKLVNVLQHVA